ncbi:DsbC family protein [Geoalkalibacter halelectricus]|uniref:DsbC family protein n=1 Tax=Geoalkalibacter halelectricus TaxID=2847045 RepID=UPI003D25B4B6
MKKRFLIAAVAFALSGAAPTFAGERSVQDVARQLQQQFPRYSFSKIEPSPVAGIYTVYGEKNITYFAAQTGHLFVGNLWSPDGRNLTEIALSESAQSKLMQLPLEKAVKIGNGRHVVIEVTDPDCLFCRRGSEYFDQRNDVTRYVFFMPLTRIHPHAEAKARFILSSPDPQAAYRDVMSGKYDRKTLPPFDDNDLLSEHLKVASWLGVRGTPNYWANGVSVSGMDTEKLDLLLQ